MPVALACLDTQDFFRVVCEMEHAYSMACRTLGNVH